jgi:hypothetical protein
MHAHHITCNLICLGAARGPCYTACHQPVSEEARTMDAIKTQALRDL